VHDYSSANMSGWQEASNDWDGAGHSNTGANDDYDFSAPGPSKAFAPLKEQHDDGNFSGGGGGNGDDTCRK
jgi:hypothetical protein